MTPVLVLVPPALAFASAALLAALEPRRPVLAAAMSGVVLVAQALFALAAVSALEGAPPLAVRLGASATLVLDRASSWLLLTAAVTLLIAWGAGPAAARGSRSHALLHAGFGLAAGAFLAANLFLLGVCLLGALGLSERRASHAAAPEAGGGARLRVGIIAVVLVAAIACIGVATQTLAFAALALRAPATDAPLLAVGAYLLFAALALLAVTVPALAWAPAARARATVPALAGSILVALAAMQALLRLYTLVFPCFVAGPCGASSLALPFGLAVGAGGALAALSVARVRALAAGLLAVATGLTLAALGTLRADGVAAALYLLPHAAFAALLLVVADEGARSAPAGPGRQVLRAGIALALAALAFVPPLSGFVGLVALLRASAPDALAVWTLTLSSVLLAAVAALRYRTLAHDEAASALAAPAAGRVASVVVGIGALVTLAMAAGPALELTSAAARQLFDRHAYVAALAAAPR